MSCLRHAIIKLYTILGYSLMEGVHHRFMSSTHVKPFLVQLWREVAELLSHIVELSVCGMFVRWYEDEAKMRSSCEGKRGWGVDDYKYSMKQEQQRKER